MALEEGTDEKVHTLIIGKEAYPAILLLVFRHDQGEPFGGFLLVPVRVSYWATYQQAISCEGKEERYGKFECSYNMRLLDRVFLSRYAPSSFDVLLVC